MNIRSQLYEEEEIQSIEYSEVPLIISEDNELVCIPETLDMPTLGAVGPRGCGKTVILHQATDQVHNLNKGRIAWLNDIVGQTQTYCMAQQYASFVERLKYLDMRPSPLPIVHLYPLPNEVNYAPKNIAYNGISVPLEKILDSKGTLFMDLKNKPTADYLMRIRNQIISCPRVTDPQDAIDYIKVIIEDNLKGDTMKGVRDKLITLFHNLITEQIIDRASPYASYAHLSLSGKVYTLPLFIAYMAAGFISVLMTGNLKTKPYYYSYLKLMIQDIFDSQEQGGIFEVHEIPTYVIFDELNTIDTESRHTEASDNIERLFTQGRLSRMGTFWSSQVYTEVRKIIRSNTSHLISFKFNANEQIKLIAKDYDLTKTQIKRIKGFRKHLLECAAITSEHFVVYDLETGKKSKRSEMIVGYAIPPLSHHRPTMGFRFNENKDYNYAAAWKLAIVGSKKFVYKFADDEREVVSSSTGNQLEVYQRYQPHFKVGKNYTENFEIEVPKYINLDSYEELIEKGYVIVSRPVINPQFRNQRIIYDLCRRDIMLPRFWSKHETLPPKVTIIYDNKNKVVAIQSPNIPGGMSRWFRVLQ